jgi:glutaredoxin
MKFTLYSKPNCPHCDQAKALLESKGYDFEVIHLDVGQFKDDGQTYIDRSELLERIPGARTMPQIVKSDSTSSVVIGGYTDLVKHIKALM